ncbi:MAG: tetratricopeptide repeat protein [Candidatus Hermodarchaeota archaeon]
MTANAIKALFEQGKYQEVVNQLTQWEVDGLFDTFTEQEQIECIYYQSYALHQGLGQFETALQIVLAARQKYTTLTDQSLLLALITQQIFGLCEMARFDEAHEAIIEGDAILESITAKERETGAYWIAFFENRKGVYYWYKKDLDTALEYYQRALSLREKIGDLSAIAHSLSNLGLLYYTKGELDTALDYYQRKLDLARQMGDSQSIALTFTLIGHAYRDKGALDTALTFYQQALNIYEDIGSVWIAGALGYIVTPYILKGELNTALEYNRRCLSLSREVYQKTENAYHLALCFYRFAWIYYSKGELDTALDYIQQTLTFQGTIGELEPFSFAIFLSALIYQARGELNISLEYLKQCLSNEEKIGNDFEISGVLFELIRVVLAQKKRPQAQEYLNRLQQLQNRTKNPRILLRSRLAEALILKQSLRALEKFQAQAILKQIVQEDVIEFNLTALAIVQLCELLILEVKLLGSVEIWEEAKALIDKLYEIAQNQRSVSMSVEALLLLAKAAAVDGDLPQALRYYEQARLTATEKNLTGLLAKVDTQQKRFEAEFETWRKLIQSNASLQERVKKTEMEDYMKEVENYVKVQQMLKTDFPREL